MRRRTFLKLGTGSVFGFVAFPGFVQKTHAATSEPFKISLAEWSPNKTLRTGKMANLDFPRVAKRDFGIDCIEFVDQFFADKATDMKYLRELKGRARGEGVKLGLIMIDTTGDLGAADKATRDQAVEKTFAWIDAAKFLGCWTVRSNSRGPGGADEFRERVVESCTR